MWDTDESYTKSTWCVQEISKFLLINVYEVNQKSKEAGVSAATTTPPQTTTVPTATSLITSAMIRKTTTATTTATTSTTISITGDLE